MKRFFIALFILLSFPTVSFSQTWKDVEFYSKSGSHKLSDYSGRTVLVMFWATWCPYCKQQMPALSLLKNLYSNVPNFEVLAISTESEGAGKVKDYYVTNNIKNLEVYIDKNSNLLHSLGFSAIPNIVLISKEGEILGFYGGLQHLDVNYLEGLIKKDVRS